MTTRKIKLELHFIRITCFMILFAFVSFHFDWKLLLYSSTSLVEKNSSTTTITWNEKERMQHRKHSLEFNYHEISLLCNQTNDIVTTVLGNVHYYRMKGKHLDGTLTQRFNY